MIVLASGEKTTPTPMENVIKSSGLAQDVVMFGRERNQTGILIEPRPSEVINVDDLDQVATFRNKIW